MHLIAQVLPESKNLIHDVFTSNEIIEGKDGAIKLSSAGHCGYVKLEIRQEWRSLARNAPRAQY
jgi:hypothetical protein